MSEQRTGGQLIVDRLRANGVDRVFTVPGESFLPVLDALHDAPDIQLVVCRQEGGATMMAEAHAKLTGRPGVCFVTRGPGSANALAGLHVASQDSTPLLVFVGQVPSGFQEREAWQEVDVGALFGSVAKWATDLQDTERLPEYLNRAFSTALSGRHGPVVMGLPENLLYASVTAPAPDLRRCMITGSSSSEERTSAFRLRMISVTSSTTPSRVANSCWLPSILTLVTEAPGMEESRVRRRELPSV